ncbi:hypothetical protein NAH03_24170 [Stenotrophomonas maltophilia]|uniref:hypothetical protein n=1 Tax=Stenotrophomonas maltophilia TaxID=40324 RepID=UPI00224CB1E8|nr:hypothetical protein [Stenotrophomonas maltophilia]
MAIKDGPAQGDFYSTANGRLLNDLLRRARDADKVALLLKVWRQRLSYRLVRSAEESKIALSSAASVETALPFIQAELATAIAGARKGEDDIAIGNIIGANILNIALVLGLPALIAPVNPAPVRY